MSSPADEDDSADSQTDLSLRLANRAFSLNDLSPSHAILQAASSRHEDGEKVDSHSSKSSSPPDTEPATLHPPRTDTVRADSTHQFPKVIIGGETHFLIPEERMSHPRTASPPTYHAVPSGKPPTGKGTEGVVEQRDLLPGTTRPGEGLVKQRSYSHPKSPRPRSPHRHKSPLNGASSSGVFGDEGATGSRLLRGGDRDRDVGGFLPEYVVTGQDKHVIYLCAGRNSL